MPSLGGNGSDWLKEKAKRIKAKLKALGINPRGNKYNTLYWRWLNQS